MSAFELSRVTAPFRMQPGLQRLAADARHLTSLATASALWREKKQVLDAGASRLAVAGFDPQPAIDAIAPARIASSAPTRGRPWLR